MTSVEGGARLDSYRKQQMGLARRVQRPPIYAVMHNTRPITVCCPVLSPYWQHYHQPSTATCTGQPLALIPPALLYES